MPGGRFVDLPPRGVGCWGTGRKRIALEGDPVDINDPIEGNEGEFIYDGDDPKIFVAGRQIVLEGHDAEPDDEGNHNPRAGAPTSCGGVRFGGRLIHRIGDPRVTEGVTMMYPDDPNPGRPTIA